MIAKVALDKIRYEVDVYYSYKVPEKFSNCLDIGYRVVVPFGKGNYKRQGIVMEIIHEDDDKRNKKSILAVLDKAPFLSKELFDLLSWIKNNYFCSIFEAYKTVVATGMNMKVDITYKLMCDSIDSEEIKLSTEEIKLIQYMKCNNGSLRQSEIVDCIGSKCYNKIVNNLINLGILYEGGVKSRNIGEKNFKTVFINKEFDQSRIKLTDKQRKVYDFLMNNNDISVKEVCYFTGVTQSVIDTMVKKSILRYNKKIEYVSPHRTEEFDIDFKDIVLSKAQCDVYRGIVSEIDDRKANVSLLYGVTGSGKTAVFMKLIDYVLSKGEKIIFMVPEISLTTQMISIFKSRYGDNISIFHSGMSDWERFDEWKKAKEGKTKIAIGTRTAVFAPFENLGLIIMDEEQEYTYKSDSSPRFHARDIAKYRCKYNKCTLLIASATPSIESYFWAEKGIYNLHKLKSRYGTARLPDVKIVDMNPELRRGNNTLFSEELINSIKNNIKLGQQSILLLNRRGYNTFAKCRACGEVMTCPNCNISFTYHADNHKLMCHYCGYSEDFTKKCCRCKNDEVFYTGAGTQKAENTLSILIPEARVIRVDADTTMKRRSHEKIFKEFENGNYDIMIGTQMVSKGLNFPNVTLVGILSADQSLYGDDFRSYERSFSLMTQVVGRAGRGDKSGLAIIQTFTPENTVINMAANQDYEAFYESEITIRKLMLYPPFSDICVIGFVGGLEDKVRSVARSLFTDIKNLVSNRYSDIPLRIFRPVPASINKVGGKYRYKMIVKCKNSKKFRDMVSEILMMYNNKVKSKNVSIFVNINPDTIL